MNDPDHPVYRLSLAHLMCVGGYSLLFLNLKLGPKSFLDLNPVLMVGAGELPRCLGAPRHSE
jgi:hypothetical protein